MKIKKQISAARDFRDTISIEQNCAVKIYTLYLHIQGNEIRGVSHHVQYRSVYIEQSACEHIL